MWTKKQLQQFQVCNSNKVSLRKSYLNFFSATLSSELLDCYANFPLSVATNMN